MSLIQLEPVAASVSPVLIQWKDYIHRVIPFVQEFPKSMLRLYDNEQLTCFASHRRAILGMKRCGAVREKPCREHRAGSQILVKSSLRHQQKFDTI